MFQCLVEDNPEVICSISERHIIGIVHLLHQNGPDEKVHFVYNKQYDYQPVTCVATVPMLWLKYLYILTIMYMTLYSLFLVLILTSSPQVMQLLGVLCVCQGVAIREKQHLVCQHLLQSRHLFLHTTLHHQIHWSVPNNTEHCLVSSFAMYMCTYSNLLPSPSSSFLSFSFSSFPYSSPLSPSLPQSPSYTSPLFFSLQSPCQCLH